MALKIVSWNVNGLRAIAKKGFFNFLKKEKPDVLCIQETKSQQSQLPKELLDIEGYAAYFNDANDKGYSGVVAYCREKPIRIELFQDDKTFDREGRIVMLEFAKFYLLNVYFPNGKQSPARLNYKLKFYDHFLDVIVRLDKRKPVIFCGDINTAHTDIDLSRPNENSKISGFLPIERQWIDKVIARGFVDCFRLFNKKPGQYTWWDIKTGARKRNVGWRIDSFFASERIRNRIQSCEHLTKVLGSDHCPVSLDVKF